ncbi:MAG: hypothetical protein HUU20_02105 [Pirellulales bacterium]|nr:hypothetical protein [Pirellulales bacterium]
MGLKGLMSGMGMSSFTIAAMVIALATFVAVVIWTFRRPRDEMEADSRLWMDDEDRDLSLAVERRI